MNKLFINIMAFMALMLCAACSDAETPAVESMQDSDNRSISFAPYIERAGSRAMEATYSTLQNDAFGVMASHTSTSDWSESAEANFMYNQRVYFNGSKWTYSPLKYWPSGEQDKVSFFAYSPFTTGEAMDNNLASTDRQKSLILGIDNHRLSFQVGQNVFQQRDLLVSKILDKTASSDPITFAFSHALCKIGFKVSAWEFGPGYATDMLDDKTTVTINAISISSLQNRAQLNMATGEWSTGSFTQVDDYGCALTGSQLKNTLITPASSEQGRQVNADNAYMMIFPKMAGSDNNLCLMIDYTVSTEDTNFPVAEGEPSKVITTRNKIYRYIKSNFEAGNAYTIHFHLGLNGYKGENNPDVDNDPTGDKPEPYDPNPGQEPEPSLPGKNNFMSFTASVSAWGSSEEFAFPLADNE